MVNHFRINYLINFMYYSPYECGKKFNSYGLVKKHISTHEPFKCKYKECSKIFNNV